MNIAVQGCLHGELSQLYYQLSVLQSKTKCKIDLLLICGDFQSLRHEGDLQDMHCPPKYKTMGSFVDYYEGRKKAPILTIFIGGNHEAVNHLRELYFGGWAAQNIYYLGQAGSVFVRKGAQRIRVSGCSGIYNHNDFKYSTRTEKYPLYGGDKIKAYHFKQIQAFRMELLGRVVKLEKQKPEIYCQLGSKYQEFDIFLSHDWPKDIVYYGKINQLYRYKSFLKEDIEKGVFGSPALIRLLKLLQPSYWFSAHMHVKYPALYPHGQNRFTHFLSLDKCLSKRSCIQVMSFPQFTPHATVCLQEDKAWLTIIYMTRELQLHDTSFYYFDKDQLKVRETKLMNQILTKYPENYSKIFSNRVPPIIHHTMPSLLQTKTILDSIGIRPIEFKGVIFPPKQLYQEKKREIQDQIVLQL